MKMNFDPKLTVPVASVTLAFHIEGGAAVSVTSLKVVLHTEGADDVDASEHFADESLQRCVEDEVSSWRFADLTGTFDWTFEFRPDAWVADPRGDGGTPVGQ
jgi:hypothetical protein